MVIELSELPNLKLSARKVEHTPVRQHRFWAGELDPDP